MTRLLENVVSMDAETCDEIPSHVWDDKSRRPLLVDFCDLAQARRARILWVDEKLPQLSSHTRHGVSDRRLTRLQINARLAPPSAWLAQGAEMVDASRVLPAFVRSIRALGTNR